MKTFIAYLKIEADSLNEAEDRLGEFIGEDNVLTYREVDDDLEEFSLLEVREETLWEIRKLYSKYKEDERNKELIENENKERAEFERLKKKFNQS